MSTPSRKPQVPDQLLNNARSMRREPTDAEQKLWSLLRDRRLNGQKFRRQHPVGPYILDFFCAEQSLSVELDGEQHAEDDALQYDEMRAAYLASHGIRVLRFWNYDVLKNTEMVARGILKAMVDDSPNSPSPPPSPGGRGRVSFDQLGFHVTRGLFSADEVAEIRDAFMEQAKDGPVEGLSEMRHSGRDAYNPTDPLSRYPRMLHPHQHPDKPIGRIAMRCMLDARLEPILRELFGDEPLAVQSMFYFKPPGARGQDLHQDNFYLRVKPGTCIAMWLAIDDADRENGGMVVVPGSGKMEIACPEQADGTKFFTTEHVPVPAGLHEEPVDLQAGDVLFFNGSVIHGSYPNTSRDRFRRALICHYVPRSTMELSNWYRTPYSFDRQTHTIPEAVGGGPCGNVQPGLQSQP